MIACLVAAALAVTGCVTGNPGQARTVDGPKGIEIGDKDLPLLLSASYQSPLEADRTFPEEKRIRLVQIDPDMAANGGALLIGSKRFVFNLFEDVHFILNGRLTDAPSGGLLGKLSEYDLNRLPRLGHGMLFPEGCGWCAPAICSRPSHRRMG